MKPWNVYLYSSALFYKAHAVWYDKVMYLPVLTESNVKDFCFLMTGISENVLATSNNFPKTSECWRTYLKLFWQLPYTFEHFPMALECIEDSNFIKHHLFEKFW